VRLIGHWEKSEGNLLPPANNSRSKSISPQSVFSSTMFGLGFDVVVDPSVMMAFIQIFLRFPAYGIGCAF
jgi:hypothetical protein